MALQSFLSNWKTTSAGLAVIATALGDILTAAGHGQLTGNLAGDITGLVAGIGLIFAGDASASKLCMRC